MPSAPRWPPERSEIRASDEERERIVSFLRDKTAEGRLTADELDERVGRAYRAVTRAELQRLVRDLPDSPLGRRTPARRRHRGVMIAGMAGFAALRLPGLALLLVWTALAVTIVMVAVIAVLAVTLGPLIALVVLTLIALRRRAGRYGALRYR
jgi:hypothetical protein